ncbi:PREDICTED: uncharacterized protein LOC107740433 [Scomber scombrus]|uniref:PREDICTED: uncharacterized protein LOC107740433 n=1 Tax=Scomber scombrus TaxID=13677 RepID=A0AAV1NAG4_SCOSC
MAQVRKIFVVPNTSLTIPPEDDGMWLFSSPAPHRFSTRKQSFFGVSVKRGHLPLTDEGSSNKLQDSMTMRGCLRADGLLVPQRRVRDVLTQINPAAAARRWSSAVTRRVYCVPHPNSLWHIDGNMRLIR